VRWGVAGAAQHSQCQPAKIAQQGGEPAVRLRLAPCAGKPGVWLKKMRRGDASGSNQSPPSDVAPGSEFNLIQVGFGASHYSLLTTHYARPAGQLRDQGDHERGLCLFYATGHHVGPGPGGIWSGLGGWVWSEGGGLGPWAGRGSLPNLHDLHKELN
jgi:hypothetical protein